MASKFLAIDVLHDCVLKVLVFGRSGLGCIPNMHELLVN